MINFLNQNDRENISKICDMDFSLIENKISNLSNFGNEKHVVTDMDIFGFHLVRTLIAYRVEDLMIKKHKFKKDKHYDKFIKNGVIVFNDANFNDTQIQNLLRKILFTKKLKYSASKMVDKKVKYDIQHGLHLDTFHTAVKCFQYENNVRKENGPFSYVIGSNIPTFNKLNFLFKKSVKRTNKIKNGLTREKNHEEWTPSFRISSATSTEKESNKILEDHGFNKETLIEGNKGTLIIANVCGLHRKFPCQPNFIRKTKRWNFHRRNPFNLEEYYDFTI
jgi:hypothetical protein